MVKISTVLSVLCIALMFGWTPTVLAGIEDELVDAAEFGNLATVKALLAKGLNPNVRKRGGHGFTPLMEASMNGHLEVVQALLAKGADVNAKSNDGRTALMFAYHSGAHLDVIHVLLAKGAEVSLFYPDAPNFPMLNTAAQIGSVELVQALLAKGADVNYSHMENLGKSALFIASENDHINVVQVLLAKGANVNIKDIYGKTVLIDASQHNHLNVVQALLAKGADVNAKDESGETALMVATSGGYLNVVQALLAKGADVNIRAKDGKNALDIASIGKHDDIMNLLSKSGAMSVQSWKGVWKGTLGKQEITACFQVDDDNLFKFGEYYYSKYRQPIRLDIGDDKSKTGSKLVLNEANGTWDLLMSNKDSLTGTWSNKGKKYPMSLIRVPIANKDELGESCGSSEFNSGRKIQPQLVTSTGTINGTQYRMVTVKDEGIASFELIGMDTITTSINDQLRKDLEGEIDASFGCTSSVLGRWGEKGDYGSIRTPILLTEHWLTVVTHSEDSCGGAHPNTDNNYQTWNRETGKLENIWTWFNASGAQLINQKMPSGETWEHVEIGPELRKTLANRWPKSANNGADSECDDVGESAYWKIYPESTGLVFTPELPHVIQACSDDIHIPYARLLPMLNEHGKAAVASIRADSGKARTFEK